jgi:hypothetical protein
VIDSSECIGIISDPVVEALVKDLENATVNSGKENKVLVDIALIAMEVVQEDLTAALSPSLVPVEGIC